MQKSDLRIVFLGTPEFAASSLDALVSGGYNIVAVVTMPDKLAGRGHKIITSPVKDYAVAHNLPVLQPEKLKDETFVEQLRSFRADLQIVVAFRMLPEVVWTMPRLGTFNLHGSLLPQYRGAAPINWAIINGEQETGVTTFFLKHEIDTGNIILQERTNIGDDETFGEVYDRLMNIGARLVTQTVDMIINGTVTETVQDNIDPSSLKPAPKIFKDTCRIDFSKSAKEIHNFVRGLAPVPCAWTDLCIKGTTYEACKIFAVKPITSEGKNPKAKDEGSYNVPIAEVTKNSLRVPCADGCVEILEMQLPGKKRLPIRDILNGLR